MAKRGEKTRAGGTWTEAKFWGYIRAYLRKAMKNWPPKREASREAIVGWEYIPKTDRKGKVEYYKIGEKKGKPKTVAIAVRQCSKCGDTYRDDERMIEMDHKIPCGSLKCAEDLVPFVTRGFCEKDGYRAVCKPCHKVITAEARKKKEV